MVADILMKRALELESWLLEHYPESMPTTELIRFFSLDNHNESDIRYLLEAYYIPLSDIVEQIEMYDNTRPKIDELKFVSDLEQKYNVNRDILLARIKRVRLMYKHLGKISIPKILMYNKLVRDKIPNKIEANEEKPIYRTLTSEEYWKSLLKKDQEELIELEQATSLIERKKELADKLEVLRAMAEFYGFSLLEIINEADKKKSQNGGFEKRIFLEKVISTKIDE